MMKTFIKQLPQTMKGREPEWGLRQETLMCKGSAAVHMVSTWFSFSFSLVFVTGRSVEFLQSELGFGDCKFLALLGASATQPE